MRPGNRWGEDLAGGRFFDFLLMRLVCFSLDCATICATVGGIVPRSGRGFKEDSGVVGRCEGVGDKDAIDNLHTEYDRDVLVRDQALCDSLSMPSFLMGNLLL